MVNIIIERFCIEHATKNAIQRYDETGQWEPGEYYFNQPSPCMKFDALRKRNEKFIKNRQKIQGTLVRRKTKNKKYTPRPTALRVRSGTGQVHFTDRSRAAEL